MPYIKVWIHFVWATKNRKPVLSETIRHALFDHIKKNARLKKIFVDRINGYNDHLHCLVSLSPDQTIAKTVQLIKGESAFWMNNKSGLMKHRFEWQAEYFAISVSPSILDRVRAYIDHQESHHRKLSFDEEYNKFLNGIGSLQT